MTWPTDGTLGWEAFGTDVTTEAELYPLPATVRGYYYDPSRLNGLGIAQEATVLEFNGSTIVVRRRAGVVEAEFLTTRVWGDALLDTMVVPELGDPCSLVLELYEDDRTTVRWAVGTSPNHARPFLMEPTTYREQEIDVAAGAASLGTVSVTVIDRPTVDGDQDSGQFTEWLSTLGVADIRGRRARLRRFISEDEGWVVIADGPAGTPRLDTSYAAYTFDIRDTRETERKLKLFNEGGEQSIVPEGTLEGYGYNPGTDTYLIDPTAPAAGTYTEIGVGSGSGIVGLTAPVMISRVAYHNVQRHAPDFSGPDDPLTWVNRSRYWVRWRNVGDVAWTELRDTLTLVLLPSIPIVPFDFSQGFLPEGPDVEIASVFLGSVPSGVGMPADGASIELQVIGPRGVPPDDDTPFTIEGLTTGEFLRNVYDGMYSDRAADGSLVPSGIRYDSAALDLMTDPVRIRLTEAIPDARDWTEKNIFAPTGWVPALDDDGRVSPVSQVAPLSVAGLLVLDNDITEPSPDWHAGDRIVNVLRVTYPRDYRPTDPEDATTGDGLAVRDIVLEFRDEISIALHGEERLELTFDAFRAIGTPDGDAVTGDTRDDVGWVLAQLRQTHVQARYSLGAPQVAVAVMRDQTVGLRAGSWVVIDLSWLPDYVTARRGLVALGQVVALGDLDCKWRQALLEVVVPLVSPTS